MANFDMAIDLGSDFVSVLTKDDDVLVKQYNYVAVSADGGEARPFKGLASEAGDDGEEAR